MASSAVRAVISGRVQGVGFRYYARERAGGLGLSGWVRNRDDGNVELEAEGNPESIEAFSRWLSKGPPSARVESVELEEIPARGLYRGFVIED
jgi:acylphosphatase